MMKKRTLLITALGAATLFSTSAQADVCGSGLALNANIWTMISAPCAPPAGSSVSDNFNDDLGTGAAYGTTWIMYKWNPATGVYDAVNGTDALEQDTGYWIYSTMGGTLKIDSTTHTTAVDPAGSGADGYYGDCGTFGWSGKPCYKLDLAVPSAADGTKWNLVGYPFVRSTPWADVHVAKYDGTTWTDLGGPTAADDAGAGVINKNVWVYNATGSGYEVFDDSGSIPGADTLLPNKSYWFQSRHVDGVSNIALLIPAPTYTVFVTSTTHTGNLGGVAGADLICQARAVEAGLTGSFTAWLASTEAQAFTRFDNSGPYWQPSGQLVAYRFVDMLQANGPMVAGIIADESGVELPTAEQVWTGTYYDGQRYAGTEYRCSDWTESVPGSIGVTGETWLLNFYLGGPPAEVFSTWLYGYRAIEYDTG